jgi:hypothetical protein
LSEATTLCNSKCLRANSATRNCSGITGESQGNLSSALTQAVVPEAEQRRQQVGDDPLRAGLDLDRHRHAGQERHAPAVDRYRIAVERNMRGIDELAALRLAGALGTP